MRLVNCTDKKTAKLTQYGLGNQSIGVDGQLLSPGAGMTIEDKDCPRVEAEHVHLFAVGALAWAPESNVPTAIVTVDVPPPAPPKNALVDLGTKVEKDSKKEG